MNFAGIVVVLKGAKGIRCDFLHFLHFFTKTRGIVNQVAASDADAVRCSRRQHLSAAVPALLGVCYPWHDVLWQHTASGYRSE